MANKSNLKSMSKLWARLTDAGRSGPAAEGGLSAGQAVLEKRRMFFTEAIRRRRQNFWRIAAASVLTLGVLSAIDWHWGPAARAAAMYEPRPVYRVVGWSTQGCFLIRQTQAGSPINRLFLKGLAAGNWFGEGHAPTLPVGTLVYVDRIPTRGLAGDIVLSQGMIDAQSGHNLAAGLVLRGVMLVTEQGRKDRDWSAVELQRRFDLRLQAGREAGREAGKGADKNTELND